MPLRRFPHVPAGSILRYRVRVEPPGCAVLNLDVTFNGARNPPQLPGVQGAPPFQTAQIANRTPEPTFGPINTGESLLLELTIKFLAAGIVAVMPTLEEPGGGKQTRDPIVFDGAADDLASADVSVRA